MPQGIWKGEITFGLVYIPVILYSAESHQCDTTLKMLDKRDLSPIGYQKINKKTGEKVPADQIVSGYEHDDSAYVILSKEDIEKIHPKLSRSIEILEFVDGKEIPPEFFEKPYYLEPLEKGHKVYALLREVLLRTGKVGIARVVIKTRQYLAALMAHDSAIMLEILHFPCELLTQDQFNLPDRDLKKLGVNAKELSIAEDLINSMSTKWDPTKYKNEYQGSLIDAVVAKIKLGESFEITESDQEEKSEKKSKVVDLMSLLKKSIAKASKRKPARKASRKTPVKAPTKKITHRKK